MTAKRGEHERTLVTAAYHEAGHAVMGILLKRLPLSATIEPDGTGRSEKLISNSMLRRRLVATSTTREKSVITHGPSFRRVSRKHCA